MFRLITRSTVGKNICVWQSFRESIIPQTINRTVDDCSANVDEGTYHFLASQELTDIFKFYENSHYLAAQSPMV